MIRYAVTAFALAASASASAAPVPPGAPQNYALTVPGSNAAGFAAPGSKIDVLAVIRRGDKLESFPLVVDLKVLAVEISEKGALAGPVKLTVSVTDQQAKALDLAQRRGCHIEVLLRKPEQAAAEHDLDAVIKKLTPTVAEAPAPRLKP